MTALRNDTVRIGDITVNYWVLQAPQETAAITVTEQTITLENGLIRRVINPSCGTSFLGNPVTGENLLTETTGDTVFTLDGQVYALERDFAFQGAEETPVCERVAYKASDFTSEETVYPPKGKAILLRYTGDDIVVQLRYEVYDGIPVIAKFAEVINESPYSVKINAFTLDAFSIEPEKQTLLYGETSYNGGCGLGNNIGLSVPRDEKGISFTFDIGPDALVAPGETFESMWGYQLLHTALPYEQRCIEVKQMYRVICPWVLDSPLIFHVLTDHSKKIRETIDAVKAVGFDMVIQSFGSDVNAESRDEKYIAQHRALADYAREKGIRLGAYTLAIVKDYRPIKGDECNVYADPKGRIIRCLATQWSEQYWESIFHFYQETGYSAIEIDGPYHFNQCEGGNTHLHEGFTDSRYLQWKKSTVEVMRRFQAMGVYINAPDWLYLSGVNKCGIGYEEVAFSQPRQEQLASVRIYNYKGSFNKIPSMGWSFLPIDVYHGGGKKASFAPLKQNLKDYEWALFQHMVSGVLPCFRGKKLYDCDETQAVVQKWVDFYKKYRRVLNGITVHFLPAVMDKNNPQRCTELDAILNCLPQGEVRGILAVFNQTDREISKQIKVPLFYTGLCETETIPAPGAGTGITEVKNPNYGDYPPPYPVSEGEKGLAVGFISGYSTSQQITELTREKAAAQKTKTSVLLRREGTQDIMVETDTNADALVDITLEPMSYTWFEIRAEK